MEKRRREVDETLLEAECALQLAGSPRRTRFDEAEEQTASIENQIRRLRRDPESKLPPGLLSRLGLSRAFRLKPEIEEKIASLQRERYAVDYGDTAVAVGRSHRRYYQPTEQEKKLTRRIRSLQSERTAIDEALPLARENHARRETARLRLDVTKALAAAHLDKSRVKARMTRRNDVATRECPYCGDLLTQSHYDHIYPVRLGGLSTLENMVFVCRACNLKKSDMTLLEFVQKYRLDDQVIFERLREAGKRF